MNIKQLEQLYNKITIKKITVTKKYYNEESKIRRRLRNLCIDCEKKIEKLNNSQCKIFNKMQKMKKDSQEDVEVEVEALDNESWESKQPCHTCYKTEKTGCNGTCKSYDDWLNEWKKSMEITAKTNQIDRHIELEKLEKDFREKRRYL